MRSVVGDLSDMKALYFSWNSVVPLSYLCTLYSPPCIESLLSLNKADYLDLMVCLLVLPSEPICSIGDIISSSSFVNRLESGSLATSLSLVLSTLDARRIVFLELSCYLFISISSTSSVLATVDGRFWIVGYP